jgi:hypothetical protein
MAPDRESLTSLPNARQSVRFRTWLDRISNHIFHRKLRAGSRRQFEKSYPLKLNREDLEDRKEDIFVGSGLIVHARSCAGFHSQNYFFAVFAVFAVQKTNQRYLFMEPDLIELVTTFFTDYSDRARHLSAFCEFTPRFSPKAGQVRSEQSCR